MTSEAHNNPVRKDSYYTYFSVEGTKTSNLTSITQIGSNGTRTQPGFVLSLQLPNPLYLPQETGYKREQKKAYSGKREGAEVSAGLEVSTMVLWNSQGGPLTNLYHLGPC